MSSGQSTLESMSQAVWYNQWTLDKFAKYLKGEILEVGCGIGNFTESLINLGNVTAIDIDQSYIKAVYEKFSHKVSAGLGDIESGKFFFQEKLFDSIVCLNVLEHIDNDIEAIKNLAKLLKPNGYLVIIVPAHQFLYGSIDEAINHYRRYSKGEIISKLNSVGFQIQQIRLLNFLGAIGWWIAGKWLKDRSVGSGKIRLFNTVAPIFLLIENFIEPPVGTSFLVIAKKVN